MSKFNGIRANLDNGDSVAPVTVRTLLSWYGAQRRRNRVVEEIRRELLAVGLRTEPDFESSWIDGNIEFRMLQAEVASTPIEQGIELAVPNEEEVLTWYSENLELVTEAEKAASFLIRQLSSANSGVTSVKPGDAIEKAISLMLLHDFSQLPVMPNDFSAVGIVSWKSIGMLAIQGVKLKTVSDALVPVVVLASHESVFVAMLEIIKHDLVLVKSVDDKRISGIVTATDLSEQFKSLSEPFLLLSEIENHLRNLCNEVFTITELRDAVHDNNPERKANLVALSELTLGEWVRLLQKQQNWTKLGFMIDRVMFCSELDKVRETRNNIMHFDPDGILETELNQLRNFARFLDRLHKVSKVKI